MLEQRLSFDYQNLVLKNKDLRELGIWIRKFIDRHGFLILQNTQFGNDLERSKTLFHKFCSSIGTLVAHNPGKKDFV